MTRLLSPLGWLVVGLAAAAILMVGGMLWLQAHDRDKAAPIKAGRIVAEGQAAAGRDAVGVLEGVYRDTSENIDQAKEDVNAIQQAPGHDQVLSRDLNRVGRRRVCNDPAYRGRAECVQHLGGGKP